MEIKYRDITGIELMEQVLKGKRDFSKTRLTGEKYLSKPEKNGNAIPLFIEFIQYIKLRNPSRVGDILKDNFKKKPLIARYADWSGIKGSLFFPYCDFSNADLSGADFIECDFEYANFSNANLSEIEFPGRKNDGKRCTKLNGVIFENCKLVNSIITGEIKNANFGNCDCSKTFFSKADLTGSTFKDANLEKSKFKDVKMNNCEFLNANCKGARFEANLKGSSITKADAKGAIFWDCDFEDWQITKLQEGAIIISTAKK
jgi:uncharacterized protein YjbI with pentapeptide repeats